MCVENYLDLPENQAYFKSPESQVHFLERNEPKNSIYQNQTKSVYAYFIHGYATLKYKYTTSVRNANF